MPRLTPRSLQKRIFLYAYLSGAEFISEEWGICNVFYDWNDYELSPYGRVKKELVDFMDKYPDVGEVLTPIGVIMPKDLPMLENVFKKPHYRPVFPYVDSTYEKVKAGVEELFATSAPMMGTETITMVNCTIPDALDLLNDGFGDISKYEYLVDLTFDPEFKKRHGNLCDIKDVSAILKKLLPCYVEAGLHWLVNKCESGGYYLSVFNHSGIVRTIEDGEYTLPEADKTVTVSFKENVSPTVLEGGGILEKDDDIYHLNIPAGDWAFIKF